MHRNHRPLPTRPESSVRSKLARADDEEDDRPQMAQAGAPPEVELAREQDQPERDEQQADGEMRRLFGGHRTPSNIAASATGRVNTSQNRVDRRSTRRRADHRHAHQPPLCECHVELLASWSRIRSPGGGVSTGRPVAADSRSVTPACGERRPEADTGTGSTRSATPAS